MIRLEYGDERGIKGRLEFPNGNQQLLDWLQAHMNLFIDEVALLLRRREYRDSAGNWYRVTGGLTL
jgi:outer membrane protein TolC